MPTSTHRFRYKVIHFSSVFFRAENLHNKEVFPFVIIHLIQRRLFIQFVGRGFFLNRPYYILHYTFESTVFIRLVNRSIFLAFPSLYAYKKVWKRNKMNVKNKMGKKLSAPLFEFFSIIMGLPLKSVFV